MKKKIVKIIASAAAVILLAAFTDVPKQHWAYSVVDRAQSAGIVKGVSDKLFEPDRNISRQEVALMLFRVHSAYTEGIDLSGVQDIHSADLVSAGIADWAKPEVAYGFENDFWKVNDFAGDGTGLASREMIARWTCASNPAYFKDYGLRILDYNDAADIDPAYYSYVDAMYKNGVMQGTGAGNFSPRKSITRAELAAIAVRCLDIAGDETHYLADHPFSYEYGTLAEINEKALCFRLDGKLINIAKDAHILINGKSADFTELSALKNKKVSVSSCLTGNNIKTVIIQSEPLVCSGSVEQIENASSASEGSYQIISINMGGLSTDFVKTADTDVLKTITPGNEVQFIFDGIYLLEIR